MNDGARTGDNTLPFSAARSFVPSSLSVSPTASSAPMLAQMSAPTPFSPPSSSSSAASDHRPPFRIPSGAQQPGSPVGQKFYGVGVGVLPTPAETFPGGLKSTSTYPAHSSLPRLPPPPEGSPTLVRQPHHAQHAQQLFPPPSPMSPSISSSPSNNAHMATPEDRPVERIGIGIGIGIGIAQPDFGHAYLKSERDGKGTGDVFGPTQTHDVDPHTAMDVDPSSPLPLPAAPHTPTSTSTPTKKSSNRPIGLGIFSPQEHKEAEERARERKRKRLAMFDLPVPPVRRSVTVQRLPGGGAVAVPAPKEDTEMEDGGVEDVRQKLREKVGWVEVGEMGSVLPTKSAEDKARAERLALIERFLDSEDSGEDEDDGAGQAVMEREGEEESGTTVMPVPQQANVRRGAGKSVPMRHLKHPATTPWEPNTGDALLALLATTRARRQRSARRRYSSPFSYASDDDGEEEEEEETVNCVCGTGVDDGSSMVQCDACSCWSHMRCVGLEEDEEVGEQWFCRSCARARKGKGRAGTGVGQQGGRGGTKGARGKIGPPPTSAQGKKGAKVRRMPPPPLATSATKPHPASHHPLKPLAPSHLPPSTPTRPQPPHREPTFAPADDSGVHGRAALRMMGAEAVVPRTPTMSVGEPTPWLGGSTPRFLPHPHPNNPAQHAQGRDGGREFGLSTPLSGRRVPAYNSGYGYQQYSFPPPQQGQGSPVKRSSGPQASLTSTAGPAPPAAEPGLWGTTPRVFDEFDRMPPPPGASTPGMYDFGSTPSRGLKFGAPFGGVPGSVGGMGMMTPGPPGVGAGKRRSWEGTMRAPTWGLLTPVVGEDSPGRERERERENTVASPFAAPHQHQHHQQQQQPIRLPGLGFWGTATPESTTFNPDYRTPRASGFVPSAPMLPPESHTQQQHQPHTPARRTFPPPAGYTHQGGVGNALLAPFSIERPMKGPRRDDESDDEGDVKHIIEQM